MEIETENKILLIDVLLIGNSSLINTMVYRQNTNNTGIYINWKSFAQNNWKWGTSKTLVIRALIYVQQIST